MLINTFLHNLAFDRENRQFLHNLHRLKTHRNYTQEQVEDIPWLTVFLCPVVRIVGDAAGFVSLDLKRSMTHSMADRPLTT